MLGLGWLSKQFGNMGNTIRNGADQVRQKVGGSQYRTPDFNPNPRMEAPRMERLTTSTQAGDIPTQIAMPERSALPIAPRVASSESPTRNLQQGLNNMEAVSASARGVPMASAQTGAQNLQMPVVYRRETPGARVEDVPIPSLPGVPGGPQAYDPIAKERFDYMYGRIPKREVEHTATDGSTYTVNEARKPTFGERFKSSLVPVLAGAARGAASNTGNPLLGAAGGAAGAFGLNMANPNMGSMLSFNTFVEPRLQEDQKRQDQQYRRGVDRQEADLGLEERRAGIDYKRAQVDALKENSGLNSAYKQSQITLNDARAKALATGKPQVRDIVDENGQSRTYQVYGDGSMIELGGSARAAMNKENNQTKKTIADNRNSTQITVADKNASAAMDRTVYKDRGQTNRAAMTQAGQDRRATASPGGAASKSKPAGSKRQAFIDAAVGDGHSRKDAEAEANRRGLK